MKRKCIECDCPVEEIYACSDCESFYCKSCKDKAGKCYCSDHNVIRLIYPKRNGSKNKAPTTPKPKIKIVGQGKRK